MTYLGILVGDRRLGVKAAENVITKLKKRLDNWRNKLLSSGGRLVLTNSSLSSLPIYTMGLYRFNEGVHKKMDSIRSNFFWRGASNKFKYHIMGWEAVCRPTAFGGLGIINSRVMKDCLLAKWIWKIHSADMNSGFESLKLNISLRVLLEMLICLMGLNFGIVFKKLSVCFSRGVLRIGDGCSTSFWGDVWLDDCPLKIKYDKLFLCCQFPDVSVANCLLEGMWNIPFKRSLGLEESDQWEDLKLNLLKGDLNNSRDSLIWCFENSGIFSVKSLYKHLTFRGVISRKFQKMWKSKLPLKVKNFLCLCFYDRVQTLDQLTKRGGRGIMFVFFVHLLKLLIMSYLLVVWPVFSGLV